MEEHPTPSPVSRTPRCEVDQAGRLQALLTEYQWLRQESLTAITNRISVMNFTFAALSVIVGSLLASHVPDLLGAGVAIVVVPQCAKAGLLIWFGEYRRTIRASQWAAVVEEKVNAATGAPGTMEWERNLKREGRHMTYPYIAVVLLLMGVSYLATILGLYFLKAGLGSAVSRSASTAITGSTLLSCVALEAWFLAETAHAQRGRPRRPGKGYSRGGCDRGLRVYSVIMKRRRDAISLQWRSRRPGSSTPQRTR
ncbi:MAG TPA: hypothetical protein VF746_14585 [Longimicrobium sp.]|jgi:hypothetical protein